MRESIQQEKMTLGFLFGTPTDHNRSKEKGKKQAGIYFVALF